MNGSRVFPLASARAPRFALPLALAFCVALAACGGGGGGSGGGGSSDSATAPPSTSAGNAPPSSAPGNPTSSFGPKSTTSNVVTVRVDASPTFTRNLLTTSVTVCVPGTSTCATIDNIQVDTGSQGLRVLASALPAGFALPAVMAGSGTAPAGECAVFGTGYTWGAVRRADVKLAAEVASSLPIQVIADPSVPADAPSACINSSSGFAMSDTSSLRVNGILGVGLFNADCGSGCVTKPLSPWYYACDSGTCTASTQPLEQQVRNPVAAFATDNNGVIIELPALSDSGAASVTGTLTFGIGTQDDNALGAATILRADTRTGYVTTLTSDGTVYAQSYLDSGSNGLFFWSRTLARCGLWFCPASPQSLSATIKGTDGVSASTSFSVANAQTLFNTGNWAFNNIAGYSGNMFGWGLPFFFGRRVFTAIEAQATPAGAGPYYAI